MNPEAICYKSLANLYTVNDMVITMYLLYLCFAYSTHWTLPLAIRELNINSLCFHTLHMYINLMEGVWIQNSPYRRRLITRALVFNFQSAVKKKSQFYIHLSWNWKSWTRHHMNHLSTRSNDNPSPNKENFSRMFAYNNWINFSYGQLNW